MQTPILYPGPGCIVEFLLGNAPVMAIVLEDQSGKLRLYTQQKRETKLAANRLLPWSGPQYGASLSRAEMDNLLETHKNQRTQAAQTIVPSELWELAEGEVQRGSALWFAGLQWAKPDIDQVAAMGHTLLAAKAHFRFTPPDFEIYTKEQVDQRLTEAETARVRGILASKGHALFQTLWQTYRGISGYTQGQMPAQAQTQPLPQPAFAVPESAQLPNLAGSAVPESAQLPNLAGFSTSEEPGLDVLETLKSLLMHRIADPGTQDDDSLWKLLTKDLPQDPHLPLLLAQAWGLVPEHHNFLLDRAGYDSGETWADEYADTIATLIKDTKDMTARIEAMTSGLESDLESGLETGSSASSSDTAADSSLTVSGPAMLPPQALCSLPFESLPFVSIDAQSTRDRDDAFHVEPLSDGSFRVTLALACPALCWPFGSSFDKAVQRRSTSLYLPDGTEHMLPAQAGWQLFSLDAGQPRPALVLSMAVSADGTCTSATPCLAAVSLCANLFFNDCQNILETFVPHATAKYCANALLTDTSFNDEQLFLAECGLPQTNSEAQPSTSPASNPQPLPATQTAFQGTVTDPAVPIQEKANPAARHAGMLKAALDLARLLQGVRLAAGAVITERPDPEVVLTRTENEGRVYTAAEVVTPPQAELAHLVVGELMILANTAFAKWGLDRDIPLLYKTQDVALPREFTGVWSTPHEIYRVVRSLPSSCLEIRPRRHAGLGVLAYTTATSPIRRYADLLNQGQIVHYLQHGVPRLDHKELAALMPFLQAQGDAAIQIQRYRPRYWKLVFFLQQGDKKWWKGVVVDANAGFAMVALPWVQLILRGKRKLFDEKTYPGQPVEVRLGKVNPLLNEITVLEVRADTE